MNPKVDKFREQAKRLLASKAIIRQSFDAIPGGDTVAGATFDEMWLASIMRDVAAETEMSIASWLRDDARHEPLPECTYQNAILRTDAANAIMRGEHCSTSPKTPGDKR